MFWQKKKGEEEGGEREGEVRGRRKGRGARRKSDEGREIRIRGRRKRKRRKRRKLAAEAGKNQIQMGLLCLAGEEGQRPDFLPA